MKYDLEERTLKFAQRCRKLAARIPLTIVTKEDLRQLIRSSGSVAANYLESHESLSKKDCLLRIKICRKEAKESNLWTKLLYEHVGLSNSSELQQLIDESYELTCIFGAITAKLQSKSS